ncbi:MAG: TlpA family protein disulfide reductase [Myxococcaceae bacterium]|nr:TlpA family protein disulfide reductase [Myxococcaceae bacterium]
MVSVVVLAAACDEKKTAETPPPERFASVKKKAEDPRANRFCEKTWAPNVKKFTPAQTRDWGGKWEKPAGWHWVNLWATWCKPCVEEMGLLNRWKEGFEREQLPVAFELLSIDESDAQAELEAWQKKNLPGHVSWVKSPADFAAFLEGLDVDKNAAIPIHVLVDPDGWLRCVRVGSIHQENYGSVRALISGG